MSPSVRGSPTTVSNTGQVVCHPLASKRWNNSQDGTGRSKNLADATTRPETQTSPSVIKAVSVLVISPRVTTSHANEFTKSSKRHPNKMSDFRHSHDKRDAWKKMSEWSHSVSDSELDGVWDEWDDEGEFDIQDTDRPQKVFRKLFSALLGFVLGISFFSFVVYRVALALDVSGFTFVEAVIVTAGVALVRYADAGVMKQFR